MITLGSTPLFNVTAGTAPITLDLLECDGTELLLIDCPHWPVGSHECHHYQDVGVRCLATSLGPGVWLYMLNKLISFAYTSSICLPSRLPLVFFHSGTDSTGMWKNCLSVLKIALVTLASSLVLGQLVYGI